MSGASIVLFGAPSKPVMKWPPPPRGPLPPFDEPSTDPETGAPLPIHKALNFVGGPPHPRVRREQFGGLRVADLPPVPGGCDADPRLFLSWFFDRYGASDQSKIVAAMRATGATHWTLSWPDSRGYGQSLQQFVQTSKLLAREGFWVCHKLFSKVYDPRNPDPAAAFPVLDALVDADAITCATPTWEMNAFVDPEHVDALVDPLADRAPHLLWYLHFLPHYAAWNMDTKTTGDTPHAFWMRRVGRFTGLEYQCEPVTGIDTYPPSSQWSAGMMQARTTDVLDRLAPGGMWDTPGFDVIGWETTLAKQFSDPHTLTEDIGDLRGFESMCSPGRMRLMGYGNGARWPDGSAL